MTVKLLEEVVRGTKGKGLKKHPQRLLTFRKAGLKKKKMVEKADKVQSQRLGAEPPKSDKDQSRREYHE